MTRAEQVRKFISQRSGFDVRLYARDWSDRDGVAAFRKDYRDFLRDGRDSRELLRFVELFDVSLENASSANGRLEWAANGRLDYCVGQYFATEYRAAACSLLANAIRRHWAIGCDYSREEAIASAKRWFSRGIVSRWFA